MERKRKTRNSRKTCAYTHAIKCSCFKPLLHTWVYVVIFVVLSSSLRYQLSSYHFRYAFTLTSLSSLPFYCLFLNFLFLVLLFHACGVFSSFPLETTLCSILPSLPPSFRSTPPLPACPLPPCPPFPRARSITTEARQRGSHVELRLELVPSGVRLALHLSSRTKRLARPMPTPRKNKSQQQLKIYAMIKKEKDTSISTQAIT